MAEKRFKITTSKKQFDIDWINRDLFKTENGVCYAREKITDDWSEIKTFEKRTSPLEKWDDGFFLGYWWLFFGTLSLIGVLTKIKELAITAAVLCVPQIALFIWLIIDSIVKKCLKNSKEYFETLSNKEIKKIIESNTWRSGITTSSKSYKNYSSRSYSGGGYSGGGSGGARSGSYSGGSSGGGYSGYSGNYISSSDLDKALKDIESKGKSWEDLANFTTDEEREKLFAEYFKDKEKGEAANDKFNREQLGPARKRTLNKIFAEAEYEDDETKENLKEKIDNFDNTISNNEFQTTVKEIRKFKERKKLKDNHIKYEGR